MAKRKDNGNEPTDPPITSPPTQVPCPPDTPSTPEEAYRLLADTAQQTIVDLINRFAPLVKQGIDLAMNASTRAETLLTKLAIADPRMLPSQIQEIQSLLAMIEDDSFKVSSNPTGFSPEFPTTLANFPKSDGSQTRTEQMDSQKADSKLGSTPTSKESGVAVIPSSSLESATHQTQSTVSPTPQPVAPLTANSADMKCNDCGKLFVVLAAWKQELDQKIKELSLDRSTANSPIGSKPSIGDLFGLERLGNPLGRPNGPGKPEASPPVQDKETKKLPGIGIEPTFRGDREPEDKTKPRPGELKSGYSNTQGTVGAFRIPNWNEVDVCNFAANWGNRTNSKFGNAIIKAVKDDTQGRSIFAHIAAKIEENKDTWLIGPISKWFADMAPEVMGVVFGVANQIVSTYIQELGCKTDSIVIPTIMEMLAGLAAKYLGNEVEEYALPFTYWRRHQCPQGLPSAADANAAFLAGTINEDTWQCWTKANNMRDEPAERIRDAQRSRLTSDQYVSLWLRGAISETQLQLALRQLGFTDKADVDGQKLLSEAVPGVSDIIRFLVRDVADERIVNTFKLDQDFEEKWAGKLIDYAKAQGITNDLARYEWRAHWDIPSPTQLYQMLHRLRPDNENVPPANRVTREHVRLALQQDDVAPFWQEKLMEISYRPITRTDAKQAFVNSTITRTRLIGALQDYGYNKQNATDLAGIYDGVKTKTLLRLPEVQAYINSYISQGEITDFLKQEKVEPDIIERVIRKADIRSKAIMRKACIGEMVKAYRKGSLKDEHFINDLQEMGLNPAHINKLMSGAKCLRKFSGKEATAAQLCQFLKDGLITVTEMETRLIRIGYKPDAAKLLSQDCHKRADDQQEKEETRKEEKRKREETKRLAEAKREAKANDAKKKKGSRASDMPAILDSGNNPSRG